MSLLVTIAEQASWLKEFRWSQPICLQETPYSTQASSRAYHRYGQQTLHTLCACAAFLTLPAQEFIRIHPCAKDVFQKALPLFRESANTLKYLSLDPSRISGHGQATFMTHVQNVTHLKLTSAQQLNYTVESHCFGFAGKAFASLPRLSHVMLITPEAVYGPSQRIDVFLFFFGRNLLLEGIALARDWRDVLVDTSVG